MNIILGSNSPRRKDILSLIFDDFTIIAPHVDESLREGESPLSYSRRVSEDKVHAIIPSISEDLLPAVCITADTIVTINGMILGKPSDYSQAAGYIELLGGTMHRVITSVSLVHLASKNAASPDVHTGDETTEVHFKKLSYEEIEEYLNSIHYMDKAGGYAFQDNGSRIIDQFHGSVTNIIGFPLRLFFSLLMEHHLMNEVFGAD